MVNPLSVKPWTPKQDGPFRVGDRVRIPFGSEQIEATVVEDYGNLGAGGRRIYGLRFRPDDVSDEISVVRPVDQLTLIARAPEPAPKGRKKKRPRE